MGECLLHFLQTLSSLSLRSTGPILLILFFLEFAGLYVYESSVNRIPFCQVSTKGEVFGRFSLSSPAGRSTGPIVINHLFKYPA